MEWSDDFAEGTSYRVSARLGEVLSAQATQGCAQVVVTTRLKAPALADRLLAAKSEDDVDVIFDEIFDLVMDPQSRQQCDAALAWIASPGIAALLHIGILLAWIRLTVPFATALPHWRPAFEAVRVALEDRQENVQDLLHGMQSLGHPLVEST